MTARLDLLIEAAPRLLTPFDPSLSQAALKSLKQLGVARELGHAVYRLLYGRRQCFGGDFARIGLARLETEDAKSRIGNRRCQQPRTLGADERLDQAAEQVGYETDDFRPPDNRNGRLRGYYGGRKELFEGRLCAFAGLQARELPDQLRAGIIELRQWGRCCRLPFTVAGDEVVDLGLVRR